MRNPIDPEAPHRACGALARLCAQGLLSGAECADALSHAARTTRGDAGGFRVRLFWDLRTAVRYWRRARHDAVARIEDALAPALDRRAPRRVLLDLARRADTRRALTADEREAVALQAVRGRLRPPAPRWRKQGER